MKVAIYSRVSTNKQSDESQLLELRQFCQKRGWTNIVEFSDVISGSKFTRYGLDKLMAEVRKGKIDVLLCFRLDRLGRSLPHLSMIVAELVTNHTALVVPSQQIDTSSMNPASQLQLHVLMAVAEFERSIIRERVNAGLAVARQRGTKLGRPEILSQHKAAVARLLAEGNGTRAIARELGLPLSSAAKLVELVRQ